MKRYTIGSLVIVLSLLQFTSCAATLANLKERTIPITHTVYPSQNSENRGLLILLPGLNDGQKKFLDYDFIKKFQTLHRDVIVITVEAHYGYYYYKTINDRLHNDIVLPYIEKGISKIWISGVSMGGLGSLLYTMKYPDLISGTIVIAPFLGEKTLIRKINNAGGLNEWNNDLLKNDNDFHNIWVDIKNGLKDDHLKDSLYLAIGNKDKFTEGARLISQNLNDEYITIIDGDHDWKTWTKLWDLVIKKTNFNF